MPGVSAAGRSPDCTSAPPWRPSASTPGAPLAVGAPPSAATASCSGLSMGWSLVGLSPGAPGDSPTSDQPIDNPEHEAVAAEGGAPTASGAPGVEAEGRHGGAEVQSGERPAADTPGMTSDRPGHAAEGLQATAPAPQDGPGAVSYTHLRAHETDSYLVCRLLLEKKKKKH